MITILRTKSRTISLDKQLQSESVYFESPIIALELSNKSMLGETNSGYINDMMRVFRSGILNDDNTGYDSTIVQGLSQSMLNDDNSGYGETFVHSIIGSVITDDNSGYTQENAVFIQFTDIVDAEFSTVYSTSAVVTGISANSAISITGGTYAINNGSYTSNVSTINPGDTLHISVTSSSNELTSVQVSLFIDTSYMSNVWTITTRASNTITDPNILLLVNDGSADRSIYSTTATSFGTVTTSTTKPFANNSLQFSSGDLTYNNGIFAIGTGDFTVDFWTYRIGNMPTYAGFFSSGIVGGAYGIQIITNGNNMAVSLGNNSAPKVINAGVTTGLTVWEHWALTRASGTCYLFKNGTIVSTVVNCTTNITSQYVTLGSRYGNNNTYILNNCLMSNIRFLNYAAWTSNFAVPTADY